MSAEPEPGYYFEPCYFEVRHRIQTSDGRMWTSLECAAHSAAAADELGLSATDTVTGRRYKPQELLGYLLKPLRL